MDAPQERRRFPRVKGKIPVELHLSAGSPQRTSIDEISLCGCYIETMFTLEVTEDSIREEGTGMKRIAEWFLGVLPIDYPQERLRGHQGLKNLRALLDDETKKETLGGRHI